MLPTIGKAKIRSSAFRWPAQRGESSDVPEPFALAPQLAQAQAAPAERHRPDGSHVAGAGAALGQAARQQARAAAERGADDRSEGGRGGGARGAAGRSGASGQGADAAEPAGVPHAGIGEGACALGGGCGHGTDVVLGADLLRAGAQAGRAVPGDGVQGQPPHHCAGGGLHGSGARAVQARPQVPAERVEWVNAILRCQTSTGGSIRDSSPSKPDASAESTTSGSSRVQGDAGSMCRGSEMDGQTLQDELCLEQAQPSLGEFVYSTPPIKHFILVRHGHYINAHVPQVSDSKQVLSQMGRQQAELTGKCLGLAHNRIPTRHDVTIYHSDMTRAVETAAIISKNFGEVSMNASPMLREGWPGTPYSTDFPVGGAAAAARNNSAFDAMQERSRVDLERMGKAFNWFFTDSGKAQEESDEESYCVLVCHANLIRFFLCRALGVDPANTWGHFEINHCGVTRIDVCANRPLKVIAVNETGHLPQSLITSSEDHL
ncbi:unnamed protein product [Phytophthora fragariaefolia]|uniref:Serine/threonine-protein phosphatase PGAM5, mitochondrial n=1 Tax=Phytophthora fragariaefolia TaxID=1490495 RepID=A0A9W6XM94_9STRA|nr:unnamed protein product [Phytophthora fragariaefolia]